MNNTSDKPEELEQDEIHQNPADANDSTPHPSEDRLPAPETMRAVV